MSGVASGKIAEIFVENFSANGYEKFSSENRAEKEMV